MAMQSAGQSSVELERGGGWDEDAWPRRGNGRQSERLATGLGWFSIGLGVAELVAPRAVARGIGLEGRGPTAALTRLCGLRELAAGVGILSERRPAAWVWSRVVGDVMDLALLAAGFGARRTNRARLAAATAAVTGVTVVDALVAQQLTGLSRLSVQTTAEGTLRVRRRITVNRPADALYRFWRDFTNAPRFMERVESVQVSGDRRTHWRARGPAGVTLEWDAEVTEERPNELIAWRSLDDKPMPHSGVVRFEPAPAGRGTVVTVELEYAPPGGAVTAAAAKLAGYAPEQQLQEDLRRFKQLMETGIVVVAQPPAGPSRAIAAGGAR
jgi:uncharacterized membrane protein